MSWPHELLRLARAWKGQGERSRWSTSPSLALWDFVDQLEKRGAGAKREGDILLDWADERESAGDKNDLETVLLGRERVFREALGRLEVLADESDESPTVSSAIAVSRDISALREAIKLVGCLRRLTKERTPAEIHAAFGAPGDFGYETPIGQALARLYGVAL